MRQKLFSNSRILTRKFLYDLHRQRNNGLLFCHDRQSANVLSRLTRELSKHPLPYRIDYSYPHHLIVYCNGQYSVHAAGWDNRMDFIPLKLDGSPYAAKYEKSFMTSKGLVNYILRKYGKPKVESEV